MYSTLNDMKIIVFAKNSSERDYLRNSLAPMEKSIVCFENEAICFDNLNSINPHAILARTDSTAVAWRFIFALHALNLDCRLFIISNLLDASQFRFQGLSLSLRSVPETVDGQALMRQIASDTTPNSEADATSQNGLLVGYSQAIKSINDMMPSLMRSSDSVIITGEAGTGKEMLARLIANHRKGESAFVKLDCSQYTEKSTKAGRANEQRYAQDILDIFNNSDYSNKPVTILLDKIHCLKKNAQSKFLLFLDGEINGSGKSNGARAKRVRFIATSEVDIAELVKRNRFRKSLYYRLNVIPIFMPALKERKEDIPILVDHFCITACAKLKRSFIIPSTRSIEKLLDYEWPGNVDELRGTIIRVASSGDETHILTHSGIKKRVNRTGQLLYPNFDMEVLPNSMEIQSCLQGLGNSSLKNICDKFVCRTEKSLLQRALVTTNWNRKKAAALLNISYKSMLNKIKMYEIV